MATRFGECSVVWDLTTRRRRFANVDVSATRSARSRSARMAGSSSSAAVLTPERTSMTPRRGICWSRSTRSRDPEDAQLFVNTVHARLHPGRRTDRLVTGGHDPLHRVRDAVGRCCHRGRHGAAGGVRPDRDDGLVPCLCRVRRRPPGLLRRRPPRACGDTDRHGLRRGPRRERSSEIVSCSGGGRRTTRASGPSGWYRSMPGARSCSTTSCRPLTSVRLQRPVIVGSSRSAVMFCARSVTAIPRPVSWSESLSVKSTLATRMSSPGQAL